MATNPLLGGGQSLGGTAGGLGGGLPTLGGGGGLGGGPGLLGGGAAAPLSMRQISSELGEQPNSLLGNVGRFLGRPGYIFRSLLRGNVLDAFENAGQFILDLPTFGWYDRNYSLANLLPESIAPHGDLTTEDERPEASDVLKTWGVWKGQQKGWQKFAVDFVGGVLTDPLTVARVATGFKSVGEAGRMLTAEERGRHAMLAMDQLKAGRGAIDDHAQIMARRYADAAKRADDTVDAAALAKAELEGLRGARRWEVAEELIQEHAKKTGPATPDMLELANRRAIQPDAAAAPAVDPVDALRNRVAGRIQGDPDLAAQLGAGPSRYTGAGVAPIPIPHAPPQGPIKLDLNAGLRGLEDANLMVRNGALMWRETELVKNLWNDAVRFPGGARPGWGIGNFNVISLAMKLGDKAIGKPGTKPVSDAVTNLWVSLKGTLYDKTLKGFLDPAVQAVGRKWGGYQRALEQEAEEEALRAFWRDGLLDRQDNLAGGKIFGDAGDIYKFYESMAEDLPYGHAHQSLELIKDFFGGIDDAAANHWLANGTWDNYLPRQDGGIPGLRMQHLDAPDLAGLPDDVRSVLEDQLAQAPRVLAGAQKFLDESMRGEPIYGLVSKTGTSSRPAQALQVRLFRGERVRPGVIEDVGRALNVTGERPFAAMQGYVTSVDSLRSRIEEGLRIATQEGHRGLIARFNNWLDRLNANPEQYLRMVRESLAGEEARMTQWGDVLFSSPNQRLGEAYAQGLRGRLPPDIADFFTGARGRPGALVDMEVDLRGALDLSDIPRGEMSVAQATRLLRDLEVPEGSIENILGGMMSSSALRPRRIITVNTLFRGQHAGQMRAHLLERGYDAVIHEHGTAKQVAILDRGRAHGRFGKTGERAPLGRGAASAADGPVSSATPRGFQGDPGHQSWESGVPVAGPGPSDLDFRPPRDSHWQNYRDRDLGEPPARNIEGAAVVVREPDGRVWLAEPTDFFGGRRATFPGGGVEPGLSVQQNAVKEVLEETGLEVTLTRFIKDVIDPNNGKRRRYYEGVRTGGAPWAATPSPHVRDNLPETQRVWLVPGSESLRYLNKADDAAALAGVQWDISEGLLAELARDPRHIERAVRGDVLRRMAEHAPDHDVADIVARQAAYNATPRPVPGISDAVRNADTVEEQIWNRLLEVVDDTFPPEKAAAMKDGFVRYRRNMKEVQDDYVAKGIWDRKFDRPFYIPLQAADELAEYLAEQTTNKDFAKDIRDVCARRRESFDSMSFQERLRARAEGHGLDIREELKALAERHGLKGDEIPDFAEQLDNLQNRHIGELMHLRMRTAARTRARAGMYQEAKARFGLREGDKVDNYIQALWEPVGLRKGYLQKILGGGEFRFRDATGLVSSQARAFGNIAKVDKDGYVAWKWPGLNAFYKPYLTVVRLAFHARNFISSTIMAMMDPNMGLMDAMRAAWRTMADAPILDKLKGVPQGDAAKLVRAIRGEEIPLDVLERIEYGGVSGRELLRLARQVKGGHGASSDIQQAFDTFERMVDVDMRGLTGNAVTKVLNPQNWRRVGTSVSDYMEASFRVNSLLALLKKGVHKDDAVTRVKRMFVDYDRQSVTETFLRDIIPFIRFTIGITPQAAKVIYNKPRVFQATVGHPMRSADDEDRAFLPEGAKEGPAIPLWGGKYLTGLGTPFEAAAAGAGIIPTYGGRGGKGIRRGLMAGLNPMLKFGLEEATNRSMYFGTEFGSYTRTPDFLRGIIGTEHELPSGDIRSEVPGIVNELLGASPTSGITSMFNTIARFARGETHKIVQLVSGARVDDPDVLNEAQRTINEYLANAARRGQLGEIQNYFVRGDKEDLPETLRLALEAAPAIRRLKRQRALENLT